MLNSEDPQRDFPKLEQIYDTLDYLSVLILVILALLIFFSKKVIESKKQLDEVISYFVSNSGSRKL
jgi:hypothetical protein